LPGTDKEPGGEKLNGRKEEGGKKRTVERHSNGDQIGEGKKAYRREEKFDRYPRVEGPTGKLGGWEKGGVYWFAYQDRYGKKEKKKLKKSGGGWGYNFSPALGPEREGERWGGERGTFRKEGEGGCGPLGPMRRNGVSRREGGFRFQSLIERGRRKESRKEIRGGKGSHGKLYGGPFKKKIKVSGLGEGKRRPRGDRIAEKKKKVS